MKHNILLLKKFFVVLLIIIPAFASAQSYTNLDTLHWMLGQWQQDDGKKVRLTHPHNPPPLCIREGEKGGEL